MTEVLGPYAILRKIGAGGMAEVHLARRFGASGWDKLVALKRLRPEHRGQPELERLLIHEAQLGARFAHPGLVGVHDLGLADGVYYLCMDFVDGADLAALVAGPNPLPRPLSVWIAEQLATTLAYVHALTDDAGRPLGLVHRDLSPANVLCSRTGELKLADFGIAKPTGEGDRTWGRLRKGKYAYMAPEQVTGDSLTSATDLFALGVTLHECLLGRRPFDGDTPLALMESIRIAELSESHDFGDLDAELVALLRRMLARDPRLRPDAIEVARTLAAARYQLVRVGRGPDQLVRVGRGPDQLVPVGTHDFATWVSATLDAGPPIRTRPQTLAMDAED